jgi:hypothetical protein
MVGTLTGVGSERAGGIRIAGVFAGKGVAGITEILTLVSGTGVRELMKNTIKSAAAGMTKVSTMAINPNRVKRK